jgi:DNA (cytosine-5)-methyltransferase 1
MGQDKIRFGSVCSGIEAASVAWEPLGWEAQWFSEIEQFPSAVLAHRFPSVPNLGDMTLIHESETFNNATIDLLVGGTPCQSFSVAGLRKGLTDPRGNLMLTFLSLAQRKKPRWIVWENVPGVLSSNGGRDFGTFLQALAELGYGFAYRVLDAQYFGVAQRRRRVFVVGYLGDWRPCASVLFEQDCLSGNTKKSREKRKTTSEDAQGGSGGGGEQVNTFAGNMESDTAATLQTSCGDYSRADGFNIIAHAFKVRGGSEVETGEQGGTPGKKAGKGYLGSDELAFTIGTTQDQQIAQPIAYSFDSLSSNSMKSSNPNSGCREVETSKTLDTSHPDPSKNQGGIAVVQPIAVDCYNQTINEKTTQTIGSSASDVNHYGAVLTPTIIDRAAFNQGQNAQYDIKIEEGQTMSSLVAKGPHGVATQKLPTMAIRRLTPIECERLQGFPDDWTLIPYRNKSAEQCPDGPRYKACGNSMAVPVMCWIGERIQMVEQLMKDAK